MLLEHSSNLAVYIWTSTLTGYSRTRACSRSILEEDLWATAVFALAI